MAERIYIVDAQMDRTGFEILVNGIPAEHAMSTHRVRMPINEYLSAGPNTITVEPSALGSNADARSPGKAFVRVTVDTVGNNQVLSTETLYEQEQEFEELPPIGNAIVAGGFSSDLDGGLDLTGLEPVGADQERIILEELGRLSEALREGKSEVLIEALGSYFQRYENSYDHAESGSMAQSFRRMLSAFREANAVFTLEPELFRRKEGMLVDCLGPRGAAIRAGATGIPTYDFWLLMGVRSNRAVIIA